MSLRYVGEIQLPVHATSDGFDHAAVHQARARLYLAHTANDALDVIDCAADRYLHSIPNLMGVAGALVSEERDLIFTSNRDENSVGIFAPDAESSLVKIAVGIRPNGLAYDPSRNLLLAANVGDPAKPGSFTVSIIDVDQRKMIADVPVAGRTRWAIFDAQADVFYVNISDPARIIIIRAADPSRIAGSFAVLEAGPHGLDLDAESKRLFCACDAAKLVVLDAQSGNALATLDLSGPPDVIFFNAARKRLYVAVGDPGVIDVFDTEALRRVEVVRTEKGAHTIGFDAMRNKVYAFLPQTHRTTVYIDEPESE